MFRFSPVVSSLSCWIRMQKGLCPHFSHWSRYFPLGICYFGNSGSSRGLGIDSCCWLPKLMRSTSKVGEREFWVSLWEECLLLQGLRGVSVLETDALLLSSLSFDLQRQGGQACDFQILELLSCGSMYLLKDVWLSLFGVSKESLAPRPLDCGCSRVSRMCVCYSTGFSFSPLLIIQPPSGFGGEVFLGFPGSGGSHT